MDKFFKQIAESMQHGAMVSGLLNRLVIPAMIFAAAIVYWSPKAAALCALFAFACSRAACIGRARADTLEMNRVLFMVLRTLESINRKIDAASRDAYSDQVPTIVPASSPLHAPQAQEFKNAPGTAASKAASKAA